MMKQNVLITGASGGIGYELAVLFAKDHNDLVLTARSEDRLLKIKSELEQKYGIAVEVIPGDLSQPEFPEHLVAGILEKKLHVKILVNNAGFGDYGYFHETDIGKAEDMINLNVLALTKLTRLLLPSMIEKKDGKILNLCSVASFFPGPMMTEYYATKAYVLSFSIALANELKGSGISVTALCPGPTASNFSKRAAAEKSVAFDKKLPTAAAVAAYGYKRLKKGKLVSIHSLKMKLNVFLAGLVPRKWSAIIVRKMQKTK